MSASVAPEIPQVTSPATKLSGPYVGLRPFERDEQSIFFGRHRDADFLRDKIFSARLTLLYAPSGVGKSSILRTLVAPALEKQNAWVQYFDNWSGEDPCTSLKQRLIRFACELGVRDLGNPAATTPEACNAAPSLTEITSKIAAVDDRTAILILDQIEEFLVAHGKDLDPLRTELAALVRAAGLDVRVVLSLRQEFLAALEPFRSKVLNLFQSTYLLDSLDDRGLRDAIERPVRVFGGEYERALTDQLVSDLRASQDREALATSTAPVDLPMMQIVCGHLWAEAAKRKDKILTLAQYKQLGGADEILEAYVRDVMPKRWSNQRLTARLMKYLAPTSGLKKPYTAKELADNENLNLRRVNAELQRLSDRRILRVREYRGQTLYELQHDAFIRFIGPWRDDVLRRDRIRHRLSRVGLVVGIVIFLVGGYLFSELKHDLDLFGNLRKESPEERRHNAETNIDTATTDLLFRWKSPELLRYLLKKNGDLIPDGYGLANAPPLQDIETQDAAATTKGATAQPCTSLCIYYSSSRPSVEQGYINAEWRYLASSYFAPRGIPVPLSIQAIPRDGYSPRKFAFSNGSKSLASVVIPLTENAVFIVPSNLKGVARDFHDRYQSDWLEIRNDTLGSLGPLIVVPRWSRPAWRVAGTAADDVRGLPAVYLAAELMRNPEPLFNDDAMSLLFDRARQICPQTLSEAIAARDYDHLRQDFAEFVKLGQNLSDLPTLLDRLAAYPSNNPLNSSPAVAGLIYAELRGNQPSSPTQLAGPWKGSGKLPEHVTSPAYEEVKPILASLQFPVKVYIGKSLQEDWFNENKPVLNPRLFRLRDKLLREYGIQLRPPLVFNASPSNPIPWRGYRIDTVGPLAAQCKVPAVSDAQLEQFMSAVEQCIVASRGYWVMAENAYGERLASAPEMQQWLNGRYSLTDQKLLMRGVVSPVAGEGTNQIPPESTLRHADWLMRSLVFWSHTADPHDATQMVAALRRTQSARLTPLPADTDDDIISRKVADGIHALEANKISVADAAFKQAVDADSSAAIDSFLFQYPQSTKRIELANAAALCNGATPPYLNSTSYKDLAQRSELGDSLVQHDSGQSADQARRLGLCLLSAYGTNAHLQQVTLEDSLLKSHSDPKDWTPAEARWLSERILSEYDPYTDTPALRDRAAQLLKSAVLRLPPNESRRAFRFVAGDADDSSLSAMNDPGPKNWRRALLKELALARPDSANLQDLTVQLLESDHAQDLNQVLQITNDLASVEKNVPNRSQRTVDIVNFRYYRAIALERLSELSMISPGPNLADHHAEVETILSDLNQYERVRSLHAQFASDHGNYHGAIDEGSKIISSAAIGVDNDAGLYQTLVMAELLSGDTKAAQQTALEAEQRVADPKLDAESRSDMLFAAALGEIATNAPSMEDTGRAFLATNNAYVPYIAMMLYSRMASAPGSPENRGSEQRSEEAEKEAQSVLEERWEKADSTHWKERLRGGDETAWREMLLGLYFSNSKANAGKSGTTVVTFHDIFDPLKSDQAFAASDLSALPMSRQDMLCEASFYAALLAEANNDMNSRTSYLQQAINTNVRYYIEYGLARYMLQERPIRKKSSLSWLGGQKHPEVFSADFLTTRTSNRQ